MRKQEQPSKRALATRAWRERETEDERAVRVLRYTLYNHRMTMEQYTALRLEQADRCGACKEPLRFGETRAVTVDHDPRCCQYETLSTGRTKGSISCGKCVRALLCSGTVDSPPFRARQLTPREVEGGST